MREQLTKYVELLFAGAPNARDIQQEILQNTLDRYDDLIAQGKSPEAAYSLSISGIGDISEILGSRRAQAAPASPMETEESVVETIERKKMRAVAIALYILCPVPLFILSEIGYDTLGLCLLLLMVAGATALMVMTGKGRQNAEAAEPIPTDPQSAAKQELRRSVRTVIWVITLCVYLVVSFATQAWFITWLVFPIGSAVQGLVNACIDLKEASGYEN